jgi:hypothetical protein
MQQDDCYFFVDESLPLREQRMSVACVGCHAAEIPEAGWFYRGSKEGYGPFVYKCSFCNKIIYQPSEGDDGEECA